MNIKLMYLFDTVYHSPTSISSPIHINSNMGEGRVSDVFDHHKLRVWVLPSAFINLDHFSPVSVPHPSAARVPALLEACEEAPCRPEGWLCYLPSSCHCLPGQPCSHWEPRALLRVLSRQLVRDSASQALGDSEGLPGLYNFQDCLRFGFLKPFS